MSRYTSTEPPSSGHPSASSANRATVAKLCALKRLDSKRLNEWGVFDSFCTLEKKDGTPYSVTGIQIPYFSRDGKTTLLTRVRVLMQDAPGCSRFYQDRGTSNQLYGLWKLSNPPKPILLVEGESDVWACWHSPDPLSADVLGVCGSFGLTKPLAKWALDRSSEGLSEGQPARPIYMWDERDSGADDFLCSGYKHLGEILVVSHPKHKDLGDLWAHWAKDPKVFTLQLDACVQTGRVTTAEEAAAKVKAAAKKGRGKRPVFHPATSKLAEEFAQLDCAKTLGFDMRISGWRQYTDGVWKPCLDYVLRQEAFNFFRTRRDEDDEDDAGFNHSALSSLARLLEHQLYRPFKDLNPPYLPFTNGLLNVETREFTETSREDLLTWRLPYPYAPEAGVACPATQAFLGQCVGGDVRQIEVLRAFLFAVLTSQHSWHRYLEILGPGASGKSTFINLATLMMGEHNVRSTQLRLFDSRFEPARLRDMRLVLVTDSESFVGAVDTFKAMIGGDRIRAEEKMKQPGEDFIFTGMVIVAANTSIRSNDYSSGLKRRRLTIRFDHVVPTPHRRNLIPEFEAELPAFVNWVLTLGVTEARRLVCDVDINHPLYDAARENLLETNHLAQWAEARLTYTEQPQDLMPIGTLALSCEQYLYPNYRVFCEDNGIVRPLSTSSFSPSLLDLLKNQFGWPEVGRIKKKQGHYFTAIRLRVFEDSPPQDTF